MKILFRALRIFVVLTVLTGIVYPLVVTVIAQGCFPYQANGSLIRKDGKVIGSELLAQKFRDVKYFCPRPSAADFETVPSGASNLGPTSVAIKDLVAKRVNEFKIINYLAADVVVPPDMIFASGSGLDPHISPEAAYLQVSRIAKARGLQENKVLERVKLYTEEPQFGILGKPRVNVLRLNVALDSLS